MTTSTYDDCSFCGGRVIERPVLKACWWGGQLLALVDGVPAGVCEQCGERYYKAAVLKQVEALLQDQERFRRIELPLAEYTAGI